MSIEWFLHPQVHATCKQTHPHAQAQTHTHTRTHTHIHAHTCTHTHTHTHLLDRREPLRSTPGGVPTGSEHTACSTELPPSEPGAPPALDPERSLGSWAASACSIATTALRSEVGRRGRLGPACPTTLKSKPSTEARRTESPGMVRGGSGGTGKASRWVSSMGRDARLHHQT